MSTSLFIVNRCGDEIIFDGKHNVKEWDRGVCDFNCELKCWMEIGDKIGECMKLFSWKGSRTNNVINIAFNEMRKGA